MASDSDPILLEIETFIAAVGMSATTFGNRAMNDPTLVHELRAGRECRRSTRERIRSFISDSLASNDATTKPVEEQAA